MVTRSRRTARWTPLPPRLATHLVDSRLRRSPGCRAPPAIADHHRCREDLLLRTVVEGVGTEFYHRRCRHLRHPRTACTWPYRRRHGRMHGLLVATLLAPAAVRPDRALHHGRRRHRPAGDPVRHPAAFPSSRSNGTPCAPWRNTPTSLPSRRQRPTYGAAQIVARDRTDLLLRRDALNCHSSLSGRPDSSASGTFRRRAVARHADGVQFR